MRLWCAGGGRVLAQPFLNRSHTRRFTHRFDNAGRKSSGQVHTALNTTNVRTRFTATQPPDEAEQSVSHSAEGETRTMAPDSSSFETLTRHATGKTRLGRMWSWA